MSSTTTEYRVDVWATIFLGSCLTFLLQPLVARALLPVLGGTSAVWVTSLATFQLLLVAGYWYAHRLVGEGTASTRHMPFPLCRMKFHLVLLAFSACWLVALAAMFGGLVAVIGKLITHPVFGTLAAVATLAGLPFVLFSANASLVQSLAGGDYRLYAVSNAGSFAGLFLHPLALEPFVPVRAQWLAMAAGAAAYACLLWRLTWKWRRLHAFASCCESPAVSNCATARLPNCQTAAWLVIPLLSTFLLNAATAHVTANVAPLPLLWAIFLGVYLLSWMVGFSACGERLMPLWAALGILAALCCSFLHYGGVLAAWRVAAIFGSALALVAFGCTGLHARLCKIRPGGGSLTRFNLSIAIGGGVGGLLSGVVAPMVFDTILEWPVAVAVSAGFLLLGIWRWLERFPSVDRAMARHVLLVVFAMTALAVGRGEYVARRGDLARGRSFYGAWRVYRETLRNPFGKVVSVFCFKHGGTLHGLEPENRLYRDEGTAYYGERGGGLAFSLHGGYAVGRPVRAGLVGLGVGTMARYGRKGDLLRFYEICPQVADIAQNGPWFDYLRESRAEVETVIGDARKSLEAEREHGEAKWDVLVVDAYSGDSIPVQLVTEEAFRLYHDRLAAGGILALHLSNWHIDLVPAAKAAARMLGMRCVVASAPAAGFTSAATWAFLSDLPLELPEKMDPVPLDEVPDRVLPRDGFGGLLPFVRIML